MAVVLQSRSPFSSFTSSSSSLPSLYLSPSLVFIMRLSRKLGMEDPLVILPNVAIMGLLRNAHNPFTCLVSISGAKWIGNVSEFSVAVAIKFNFVQVRVLGTTVDQEFAWTWDILDEPRVDTRPVHLGVGDGRHNLHDGPGDGVVLGHPLYGWHNVLCVLPHGEQMRSHSSLESLLGILPVSPPRLSSIINIIWGNKIYYLED